MATRLSIFSIVVLLLSTCEKDTNDPYGQLCDALSQPRIVVNSYEIYVSEIITPNGDGINDGFYFTADLNEIFENVSFKVYDKSSINPIFTLENEEISYWGSDADGNYFGDGVYTYELTLGDTTFTRLLGVYKTGFCLDDFNCSNSSGRFVHDPLFTANCD